MGCTLKFLGDTKKKEKNKRKKGLRGWSSVKIHPMLSLVQTRPWVSVDFWGEWGEKHSTGQFVICDGHRLGTQQPPVVID